MAKIDVSAHFVNRLNPLKNTVWEKLAISVIGAKCVAELSSSITLIASVTLV